MPDQSVLRQQKRATIKRSSKPSVTSKGRDLSVQSVTNIWKIPLDVAMSAGVGNAIPACVGYYPSPADSLRLNQFTLQSVVSDKNLWKEIDDCEDIVTCSFWVCGDEL